MNRITFTLGLAALMLGAIVSACDTGTNPVQANSQQFPSLEKEASGALLEALDGAMSKNSFVPLREVSAAGMAYLKEYEGEILCEPTSEDKWHCPYNDSSNYCTIGHGHLIAGRVSCQSIVSELEALGYLDGISEAESEALLRSDLEWAQRALERQMDASAVLLGNVELSESQYDALVSFIFNVGAQGFQNSTLLKRLKSRERIDGNVEIAAQFVVWNKSGGEFVQGLLNRRNKEVDQFFAGFERPVTPKSTADEAIDIRVGEPSE